MYKSESFARVRYAETDQMKIVYYGNYAQYFEIGRVEALRSLGVTYKSLEDNNVIMPVVELSTRFRKPFFYDDLITIHTIIPELPSKIISFKYLLYNEGGDLCCEGFTKLVFKDKTNNLLISAPEILLNCLKTYF